MSIKEPYPLPDWYSKRWMVKPAYPTKWPNGARIAVCVHVPLEVWSERPATANDGRAMIRSRQTSSWPIPNDALFKYDTMAMCEHDYGGRVGIWRMLDLLDKYQIKGSFPVTGAATVRYRDAVREIYRRGHEVLARGFYQEEVAIFMTPKEQKEDLERTTKALLSVASEVGAKREKQGPLGHIASTGKWTPERDEMLSEQGYLYVSDIHNDDRPYCTRINGKPIVSVPLPDIGGAVQDNSFYKGYTPHDIFGIFKDEFDYWYEQGGKGSPGMVTMICHPYLGGRAHVTMNWERMINYAMGHPHVWFPKRLDIARWTLKNWPPK